MEATLKGQAGAVVVAENLLSVHEPLYEAQHRPEHDI